MHDTLCMVMLSVMTNWHESYHEVDRSNNKGFVSISKVHWHSNII